MGRKVYEVEDILDSRYKNKKRFFLIKWKGYSVEESTWEPESNLNCPAIIAKYNAMIAGLAIESDNDETEDSDVKISKRKKNVTKARANSIVSSPSSGGSMTPPRRRSTARDLSPERVCSKPSGILQFFKPTTEALPAPNSDDLEISSVIEADRVEIDTADEEESRALFNESMKRFQKMLSRVPGPPLTIKNDYDLTPPPQHFIYINETIYGPGVIKPHSSFLVGCSCYVIDESVGGKSHPRDGCCTNGECQCIAQNPEGRAAYDADGLLNPETSVIYECNKRCACSIFNQPCKNRVIQMGRQVSLTIVRLPDQRGWGVVANHDIPRGTFIDLYLGEANRTSDAADRLRSDSQNGNNEASSYLFDLDFNYEAGTDCEFTLDAYRYGNVSHFFNHSCSPNLKVYPCFIEHLDPRLHSIAFFASRPISKGDQLTFDYMGIQAGKQNRGSRATKKRKSANDNEESDEDFIPSTDSRRSSISSRNNSKKIKCLCGSANCRKFIYF